MNAKCDKVCPMGNTLVMVCFSFYVLSPVLLIQIQIKPRFNLMHFCIHLTAYVYLHYSDHKSNCICLLFPVYMQLRVVPTPVQKHLNLFDNVRRRRRIFCLITISLIMVWLSTNYPPTNTSFACLHGHWLMLLLHPYIPLLSLSHKYHSVVTTACCTFCIIICVDTASCYFNVTGEKWLISL